MIWGLVLLCTLIVVGLYRRMLTGVDVFVPARTHVAGWGSLSIADGSDTRVFLGFTACFVLLLAVDWPMALVWVVVVFTVWEIFRRSHNNRPIDS